MDGHDAELQKITCLKPEDEEEIEESVGKKEKGSRSLFSYSTKGNQRWMKLRTTVQLSGAISSNIHKTKPTLKREDSFLKRFSTRQIPELEETVDPSEDCDHVQSRIQVVLSRFGWLNPFKKKRKDAIPITVVNTDGRFYYTWLLIVSLSVLYNLWTLIVREAFPELQLIQQDFWTSMDILTDIVFMLDILVQFRTGYLEQGLMVYDSKKLAGHYMRSKKFFFDIMALIPLDLMQLNIGIQPMLRFPRFFKIYRVYNYYYIVESRTVYPNVWRVVNLIHILLILAHWFGCFYYLLSESEAFQGDWVYPYRPGDYATLGRKYLGSLYWSTLTLTTIGDLPTPETNRHPRTGSLQTLLMRGHKSRLLQFNSNIGYIFTIVSYLIGVFIFATIVGQVGNVITNRNANRLEFERLLDGAKTYMRHHKVPGGMKRRILRWYDYSWSRGRIQGGGDINTALGLLPDKLKTELALHVNLSVLKKVTIFQKCQPEFLHDLVLKMKAYIFTPGDLICRKGEVAREMFIIADGILEVKSETGYVLTTMQAGDFFGEIGILSLDGLNKRTADVRSVGYSELFSLSREDVLAAVKDYPEAKVILQNFGQQRLAEARKLTRAWKISAQQKREKAATATTVRIESEVDTSKRSIVEKITGDVKELRNVFRKSTRTKSDCIELEPSNNPDKENRETTSKAVLSRVPCINEDNSDDEGCASSSKIGAGLPLFQRLKLLKEKQAQEQKKNESRDTVSSHISEEDKKNKEGDFSNVPLLQRILLMKQKEEKKAGVVQSTANMAAEVLASTVRTQLTSPTQLTLRSNQKSDSDDLNMEKKRLNEENKKGNSNKFKEICVEDGIPIDSQPHSTSFPPATVKTISEKKNTYEADNESWILIKKAVLLPNNSMELHEKRLSDIKIKYDGQPDSNCTPLTANTDGNILHVCMSDEESKLDEAIGGEKTDTDITASSKDKKSSTYPFLGYHSNISKTYESIDDLSPEYLDLPFVKKLKILNERQKLAQLQEEKPPRTVPDLESNRRRAPRPEPLHFDTNYQSFESPLLSPESNETLERRKLKSILKKLSSSSASQSGKSSSSDFLNFMKKKNPSEMRKLLRAQTMEGYAARHSKFTKSVTFNQETLSTESESDQIDEPETDGDNSLCSTRKNNSKETDNQNGNAEGTNYNIVASSDSVSSLIRSIENWEAFKPSTSSESQQERNASDAAFTRIQREIISSIFKDIRRAINQHMGNIESKCVSQYIGLQLEVRRRDEMLLDLSRRLKDIENDVCPDEEEYDEEEDENSNFTRPKCKPNVFNDSLENLSLSCSPSGSTIINLENNSLDEVFFPNHSDWELYLLAEEMVKHGKTTRHRAVSFDSSQLQPKPSISQFSERMANDSSTASGSVSRVEERGESSRPVFMGRRSLSENNIETRSSGQLSRKKRYSHNGTHKKGDKNSVTKRFFKK